MKSMKKHHIMSLKEYHHNDFGCVSLVLPISFAFSLILKERNKYTKSDCFSVFFFVFPRKRTDLTLNF